MGYVWECLRRVPRLDIEVFGLVCTGVCRVSTCGIGFHRICNMVAEIVLGNIKVISLPLYSTSK